MVSNVAVEPDGKNGTFRIKITCGGSRVRYYRESDPNNMTCSAGEADTFKSKKEAQEVANTIRY